MPTSGNKIDIAKFFGVASTPETRKEDDIMEQISEESQDIKRDIHSSQAKYMPKNELSNDVSETDIVANLLFLQDEGEE